MVWDLLLPQGLSSVLQVRNAVCTVLGTGMGGDMNRELFDPSVWG